MPLQYQKKEVRWEYISCGIRVQRVILLSGQCTCLWCVIKIKMNLQKKKMQDPNQLHVLTAVLHDPHSYLKTSLWATPPSLLYSRQSGVLSLDLACSFWPGRPYLLSEIKNIASLGLQKPDSFSFIQASFYAAVGSNITQAEVFPVHTS